MQNSIKIISLKLKVKKGDVRVNFIKLYFMKKIVVLKLLIFYLCVFSCSRETTDFSGNNIQTPSVSFNYPKSTRAKNYLSTSYNFSNYELWINSNDILENGNKYTKDNPLLVIQTAQLDINMDGFEDIFTYDSYPLNIPTPNPPPSIFMGNGNKFNKVEWKGPILKNPHGTKLLIGDFNGDGYPDIFSLVAVDPPNGAFPGLTDFNNLLFNSPTGFTTVKEFQDQLGFWYTGCSGDIDNDGDLDVVMFNFHVGVNGVKNKILWNDGKANFLYDSTGIGLISTVDQSELFDVNADGYLDLIIDHIDVSQNTRTPEVEILLGNGKGFSLNTNPMFILNPDQFLHDIDFADLDKDSIQELILSGYDGANNKFWIEIYKSGDRCKSYEKATARYIDNNVITKRFDKLRVQDIDGNGKLDIISSDRADNVWWEWNGSKFIQK